MAEDIMTAPTEAEAGPASPPLPPEIAPVGPTPGSPEWLIEQIDQLNFKMDRIIQRFM